MGAGGEVELVHGLFEVAAGCLIQLAAGLELAGAHGCIRGCGGGAKALTLDVACGLDAGGASLDFGFESRLYLKGSEAYT